MLIYGVMEAVYSKRIVVLDSWYVNGVLWLGGSRLHEEACGAHWKQNVEGREEACGLDVIKVGCTLAQKTAIRFRQSLAQGREDCETTIIRGVELGDGSSGLDQNDAHDSESGTKLLHVRHANAPQEVMQIVFSKTIFAWAMACDRRECTFLFSDQGFHRVVILPPPGDHMGLPNHQGCIQTQLVKLASKSDKSNNATCANAILLPPTPT